MLKKLFGALLMIMLAAQLSAQIIVEIGNGTDSNSATGSPTPYGTYYKSFHQQYLIRASELVAMEAGPGLITSISFNVSELSTCSPMPDYTIRLRHTTTSELNTTFETGTYTEVFYQASFMPVAGWNTHSFPTSWNWDGTSNIIVDINTTLIPGSYTRNASVFYTSTTFQSCLRSESDSSNASGSTTGTLSSSRANIRLNIQSVTITDPPAPATAVFPTDGAINVPNYMTLSWLAGDGFPSGYRLSLGTDNPPTNILNNQDMGLATQYQIPESLELGEVYYWQVVPYNAVGSAQDCPIWSFHTDSSSSITVGDGSTSSRIPFDFWYRNSLFECIYYPQELDNVVGSITGVEFYNDFDSNLSSKPVRVWIGSTSLQDLSESWIPSSELSLVFDGVVDFPSGQNTISIPFSTPYQYLDSRNLVLMMQRPMDTEYFNSSDVFKCQDSATTRSRNAFSDNTTYDPAFPPAGTAGSTFPKTTFKIILGGVGHITGVVRDPDNQVIPDVEVSLSGDENTVQTDSMGEFSFRNLVPDTYTLGFNKHGYHIQELVIELDEDETEILNIALQPIQTVTIQGTLIASDTMQGIPNALMSLHGYEDYSAYSAADGSFCISGVYANMSYTYRFTHDTYSSINGEIIPNSDPYLMGIIVMNELAFAPHTVLAELSLTQDVVTINWQSPDPDALGIEESFEETAFPPQNWSSVVTNTGPALANGAFPTWFRAGEISSGSTVVSPTEGSFQAGLWWIYGHQDEWLISAPFSCPSDAILSFESHVFLGSQEGDSCSVKISSNDGASWTTLWNASEQSGGWNNYDTPISIDLSAYSGRQIKLAFHAEDGTDDDGLWYEWFIDEVKVVSSLRNAGRSMQSYDLWRFPSISINNPEEWDQVNDQPITQNSFTDGTWSSLTPGEYLWAVRANYTNGLPSSPAISNTLVKGGGLPAQVQNFSITLSGMDAHLSWDPVTTDTSGNPLQITDYEIHVLNTPDELPTAFTVLDYTSETSYIIPELTPYVDKIFFCVKARTAIDSGK